MGTENRNRPSVRAAAASVGGKVKRTLLSWVLTPERARRVITNVIAWMLQRGSATKAWSAISALPRWLRKLADLIDMWNGSYLPEDKEKAIAELVEDAVTDEAVDRLIDSVAAMGVKGR